MQKAVQAKQALNAYIRISSAQMRVVLWINAPKNSNGSDTEKKEIGRVKKMASK